ncbi:MAG: hypothetical protein B6I20_07740 [Bacteroidetes bacterium 4572_117]|nr:MAG: hypothetical protein B6I20_07740 [Bacteroidetes bacterium 4572_117]
MKKFILLYILFLILVSNTNAQLIKEPRGFIKFGMGYFLDVSRFFDNDYVDGITGLKNDKTAGGKSIWIEGGYKLPNKIIISANIMFASARYKYIDIVYLGASRLVVHQNYALNFSYEFNQKTKHKFTPGIGFLYNRIDISRASYSLLSDNGQYYINNPEIIDGYDEQLGINLNLDYYYQFKNNFFMGARVNTIYLISIGLEGFVFSPVLGVKF